MKIALDAMGGDFAPDQVVAGGVQAHRELGVEVIFVGAKDKVDAPSPHPEPGSGR